MTAKQQENIWSGIYLKNRCVSYEVAGEYAIFSDPVISLGSDKLTLPVPTYEAMRGLTKNIFSKPAFYWHIRRVRVMNPIRTEADGVRLLDLNGGSCIQAYNTYLTDVRYQVEAELRWNKNHPELRAEWSRCEKYIHEFARAVMQGGRMDPFLGKSECVPSYIKPVVFGEGSGYYDGAGKKDFGIMYHSLTYADLAYDDYTRGHITENICRITMDGGVIEYPEQSECFRKRIRPASVKVFAGKILEKEGGTRQQGFPRKTDGDYQ